MTRRLTKLWGSIPALLLFALLLRVLLLVFADRPDALLAPDSAGYFRLARGLAVNGCYGTQSQPEIFRVPGDPFSSPRETAQAIRQAMRMEAGKAFFPFTVESMTDQYVELYSGLNISAGGK